MEYSRSNDNQFDPNKVITLTDQELLSLNPSQLQEWAHNITRSFFGEDQDIDVPPRQLLERQKRIADKGWLLAPFYFPSKTFSQKDNFPGWKTKPVQQYWDAVNTQRPGNTIIIPTLDDYWGLIDVSRRPNKSEDGQFLENDPLGPIIEQLRATIEVPSLSKIPTGSRFGISTEIQDRLLFPALIRELGLVDSFGESEVAIERLTGMEFNYAGNFSTFSHFGEADTLEWLGDTFYYILEWIGPPHGMRPRFDTYTPVGGCSQLGGVAHVGRYFTINGRIRAEIPSENIAFRPVIKLPLDSKKVRR